jgi:ATP/maltotriose-dependent transcriptional regulator MalT
VEAAGAAQALAFVRVLVEGRTALPHLEAAAERAGALGDPFLLVDAFANVGEAHLLLGETTIAAAEFAQCLEVAAAHGDETGEVHGLVGLGGARLVLGRYDEADETLRPAVQRAGELGESHVRALALARLGELLRLRGDLAGAERWFSDAGALARGSDHPLPLVLALVGLGRLAHEGGDASAAYSQFESAYRIARSMPLAPLVAPSLSGMAATTADPMRARSLAGESLRVAQRHGDRVGEALAFELMAQLTWRRGNRLATALRHCRALELRAAVGDPAATAGSLEALAILAAARSDLVMSARLVGSAAALRVRHGCARSALAAEEYAATVDFVRLGLGEKAFEAEWRTGAALSMQAAVKLALKSSCQKRPQRTTRWECLTPTEWRVVELVAEGLTNIQIAHALDMAEPTVRSHLRQVFRKVGVQTRSAVAVGFHRQVQSSLSRDDPNPFDE